MNDRFSKLGDFMFFDGYELVEDKGMTELDRVDRIKRTLKERLFSFPWKPLQTHRMEAVYKPSGELYKIEKPRRMLIGHPTLIKELIEQCQYNS